MNAIRIAMLALCICCLCVAGFALPVTALALAGRSTLTFGPGLFGASLALAVLAGFAASALRLLTQMRDELRLLHVTQPDREAAEPAEATVPAPAEKDRTGDAVAPLAIRSEPPRLETFLMPDRKLGIAAASFDGQSAEWSVSPGLLSGVWRDGVFVPLTLVGTDMATNETLELAVEDMAWIGPKGGRQVHDAATFLRELVGK